MNTPQTMIRVEPDVKNAFRDYCRASGTTMTAVLIDFMKNYIGDGIKERSVIEKLASLERTRQTGLVLDASSGAWVPQHQKPSSVDDESYWKGW